MSSLSAGFALVVLSSLGLSFFLSGMESGVFALSRLRIRQQMRAGNRSARVLHGYLENPEDFLWTILLGNTLANFAAVSLLAAWLFARLEEWPALLVAALLCAVFLLYALGDLLPKMLFRAYPNRLCLRMARPFQAVHFVLWPGVRLLARLSGLLLRWSGGQRFTGRLFGNRDELRQVMQESGQALTSDERAMVNRVLDLQHHTVGSLAVPLDRVISVTATTPVSEVLALCREHHLSRLPVREGPGGRIAGIVTLRNVLYRPELDPERTVGELVQPALYLDEATRLEVALRRLRQAGQRLAIVLGRERREIGILTLKDILKFIFGEVSL